VHDRAGDTGPGRVDGAGTVDRLSAGGPRPDMGNPHDHLNNCGHRAAASGEAAVAACLGERDVLPEECPG